MSTFKQIPTQYIEHSLCNPRRMPTASDPKVIELSDSIASVGLIQPISVRKNGTCNYTIIAGARRFEACKLAGLAMCPCMVFDITADEALKLTVTENLQREDLTPLEEGRGIASLLASGRSTDEISADIAKSQTWVRRRAKLADLTERWQAAVDQPLGILSHFSAAHLEVIAHLSPNVQDSVLDGIGDDGSDISLKDLKGRLRAYTHFIHEAAFPVSKCDKCDTRSDREPDLFAGLDGSWEHENKGKARCMNSDCWDQMQKNFIETESKKIAKKVGVMPVLVSECGDADEDAGIVEDWRVHVCEKGDVGAKPAMYVDGDNAGSMFYITDNRPELKTVESKDESTIEQRRLAHKIKAVTEWIEGAEDCPKALQSAQYQLSALCCLGEHYCQFDPAKAVDNFKQFIDGKPETLANAAWMKIKAKLFDLMPNTENPDWLNVESDEPKAALALEICGLDPQDFIDAAEKAFPDEKKSTKKTNKGAKK